MNVAVMTSYNEREHRTTRKTVNLGLEETPEHYAEFLQFEGGQLADDYDG